MLKRETVVKASFFAKQEKQLEFLIKAFARIVGKENINYLVPKFQYKSQIFILNMDIRIPNALLKSDKYLSSKKEDELAETIVVHPKYGKIAVKDLVAKLEEEK